MLVPSLLNLAIALVAVHFSVNVKEELVQLAAVLTAVLCLLLSLVFAPWFIKVAIVVALVVTSKRSLLKKEINKQKPAFF